MERNNEMFEEYEYGTISPSVIKNIIGVWKLGRVLRILDRKGNKIKCVVDIGTNSYPDEQTIWIPLNSINKI